jgi:hypothetical protein
VLNVDQMLVKWFHSVTICRDLAVGVQKWELILVSFKTIFTFILVQSFRTDVPTKTCAVDDGIVIAAAAIFECNTIFVIKINVWCKINRLWKRIRHSIHVVAQSDL